MTLTLPQIAEQITAHLKRMEADPQINTPVRAGSAMTWLYQPWAYHAGARLAIVHKTWQVNDPDYITKPEALAYLAWLDAGNNGDHREAALAQAGGKRHLRSVGELIAGELHDPEFAQHYAQAQAGAGSEGGEAL